MPPAPRAANLPRTTGRPACPARPARRTAPAQHPATRATPETPGRAGLARAAPAPLRCTADPRPLRSPAIVVCVLAKSGRTHRSPASMAGWEFGTRSTLTCSIRLVRLARMDRCLRCFGHRRASA
ncbi:hypothetical protein VV02_03415 [Luteipulveratus mongoliensis]|uniref:Uncharacterized protein n=1 Tax=Luteipulveratus mongoliensis TaxID=571913 RepID=A0A0K1JEK4_9MICO|nr:hypothetical protein VV02_03415 [Luteipulveratus mongoliensis]